MPPRHVLGYLAPACPPAIRRIWNEMLRREGRGDTAFFDGYRARTREDLQLRLSEMYLLQRRGYAVGKGLEGESFDMMDKLDATALEAKMVDTVVNDGGVFTGYWCGDILDFAAMQKRYHLFFGSRLSDETAEHILHACLHTAH